jgi:hypothetical protein
VSVAEGVRVESGRGAAQFALSRSGVLAYAPGAVMSVGILVRADRAGKLDTIPAPPANYSAIELSPDGRRIVARVGTATGDQALQVIDAVSGRVTPWLSGPSFGRPKWTADGHRVVFRSAAGAFSADPDVSEPPRALALPAALDELSPLADSASYRGWIGDTMVVVHTDGRPGQRLVSQANASASVSADDRWLVSEESQGTESAIVGRALDGTGRRIVIAGEGRYSMAAWAAGGREFIVADAQRMRSRADQGRIVQGFHAISYDPSKPDQPFGEPRQLFAAPVADFPGRDYAVAMGGNRFVFKQHVATSPPREVRIIARWHAALERAASGNNR